MFATHQLLTFDSDGCRGHRQWLTDPSPAQLGSIMVRQYYAGAWELRNIATGESTYVMTRRTTHANVKGI
jgi:hypothetical protein